MKLLNVLLPLAVLSLVGCSQEIPPAHKGRMFDKTGGLAPWTGGRGFEGAILTPGTHYVGVYPEIRMVECARPRMARRVQGQAFRGRLPMKLYLVTRADLRHGSQAAQLAHGLAQFAVENHDSFLQWNKASNTVVCLAVQDEEELTALHSRLDSDEFFNHDHLIDFATFREPDMNDSLTCIALMSCPCDKHRDVCIDIPLSHA